jgi:hypothetical protein
MTKYRIVERWYSATGVHYLLQKRYAFFFWENDRHYDTILSAKHAIEMLVRDESIPKDKVIHEE